MDATSSPSAENVKNVKTGHSSEIQECIDNCLECHKACEQLIPHCLSLGGRHAERRHIQHLWLCADICRTSAHFMMWSSELHHRVCALCADICEKCAEDCERLNNDEMMQKCIDACYKCVESCRKMAMSH